jgi:hypothetical protein
MPVGWAIVIAGAMISAAIYFSTEDKAMVVLTACGVIATLLLVVLTFLYVRATHRIEWFTGAMERHSDQMRQIAAKEAKIKMIWWDKTEPEAAGDFPFDGQHGKEHQLDTIHIGIPMRHRYEQSSWWQRFLGSP